MELSPRPPVDQRHVDDGVILDHRAHGGSLRLQQRSGRLDLDPLGDGARLERDVDAGLRPRFQHEAGLLRDLEAGFLRSECKGRA